LFKIQIGTDEEQSDLLRKDSIYNKEEQCDKILTFLIHSLSICDRKLCDTIYDSSKPVLSKNSRIEDRRSKAPGERMKEAGTYKKVGGGKTIK